jgi:hypothetical protein
VALIKWIEEENPIDCPNDDAFDLQVYARRIARILNEKPFKTIALVGPYGCGKSSILKMVNCYLNKNIIFCEVSAWGFHEGSASEHILETAIHELSKYVDCLGLVRLPSHYQAALSKCDSSWIKSFSELINSHRDPVEVLNKLDDVLYLSKMQLVIYLEDIDRNFTAGNNTTTDSLFNEVASLLDRLKNLKNVSFVLTVKEDLYGLIRIAEHMEFVSSLPHKHVTNLINKFRDVHLKQFDYIDSVTPEVRGNRLGMQQLSPDEYAYNWDVAAGITSKEPINVMASFLDNPRTLKIVFRRTRQAWRTLYGEIDFDDLLIANVIRFVSPNTFLYINENLAKIRLFGLHKKSNDKDHPFTDDPLYIGLKNTTVGHNPDNIFTLVNFLFPGWNIGKVNDANAMPQGVAQSGTNDYWERLTREELLPGEDLDQEVLKTINDWKANNTAAAFRKMTLPEAVFLHPGFADKIEQFGRLLNVDQVLEIASQIFVKSLKANGNVADSDNTRGFSQLRLVLSNLLEKLSDDGNMEKYHRWILQEIHKAFPISITFVTDLINKYGYYGLRPGSSLSQEQLLDFKNMITTDAKSIYNDPNIFAESIDPSNIFCIFNFLSSLGQYGKIDPDNWRWLKDLLLATGKQNARIIVPQIVALLHDKTAANIPSDVIQKAKWFGEDKLEDILKVLAQEIDLKNMSLRNAEIVMSVRKIAEEWLTKNGDSKKQ